ncbi:MAG: 30S ribosomal protein S6 [Chloroflexi bacterium]|nr:30S ribosomal protein S6 [Chloroflexota bacterium]
MQKYEAVVVFVPTMTDDELPASVGKVTKDIETRGGTVTKTDVWGRRKMAYPVRSFKEGNYVLAEFTLTAERVKDLSNNLKLSEQVLRYLIVKQEA